MTDKEIIVIVVLL